MIRYLAKNVFNVYKINDKGNAALMEVCYLVNDENYVKCLIKMEPM